MSRSRTLLLLAPSLCLALAAPEAPAFSSGPPPGRTGAPLAGGGNELTCQNGCHSQFPLDSGDGAVTIFAPDAYAPGEVIEITVMVDDGLDDDAQRWGFQLTAKDDAFAFAGTLIPDGVDNQLASPVFADSDRYIEHTSAGTAAGQIDGQSWTFDWEAPMQDAGPVTFYAVGNAANGDTTNQGDRIYSTSITLPEPGAGALAAAAALALCGLRRRERREGRGEGGAAARG